MYSNTATLSKPPSSKLPVENVANGSRLRKNTKPNSQISILAILDQQIYNSSSSPTTTHAIRAAANQGIERHHRAVSDTRS
jgi:hypothetical protein